MGEDFEIESCPRCGSDRIDTVYDEFGIIRLSLSCRNCYYIEAYNPDPDCSDREEEQNDKPWEIDPDSWKGSDGIPD